MGTRILAGVLIFVIVVACMFALWPYVIRPALVPLVIHECSKYYYAPVPPELEGRNISINDLGWPWYCIYIANPMD